MPDGSLRFRGSNANHSTDEAIVSARCEEIWESFRSMLHNSQ